MVLANLEYRFFPTTVNARSPFMDGMRELTFEEIDEVSGGTAGVPTLSSAVGTGGITYYSMSCGTGYSIYEPFNPTNTGLSVWTNPVNYGCSTGTAGAFAFTFASQGGIAVGGSFSAIDY
jgi:hypothetical protein